jgi:Na+/proline symporter
MIMNIDLSGMIALFALWGLAAFFLVAMLIAFALARKEERARQAGSGISTDRWVPYFVSSSVLLATCLATAFLAVPGMPSARRAALDEHWPLWVASSFLLWWLLARGARGLRARRLSREVER